MSHRDDVESYVDDVLSGKITAGRYVRMACKRYLADLENGDAKGWYFDEEIASRQISVMECLKHTKGSQWAGKPFLLSPSQKFIMWNVLGFRWQDSKYRRFKRMYATVGRKWGKSTLVSAIACCLMYADVPIEVEAECYAAATKSDQAARLVTQAAKMIEKTSLKEHALIFKNRGTVKKIELPGDPYNGTYFEPLGNDSDTQDALNPHLVFKDELHAWKKNQRELNEKLDTGGGARVQPLDVTITTAGSDKSDIWLEYDAFCCKVVESAMNGQCIDDTVFAFIARIDEKRPCHCGGRVDCEACGGTGDIPGDDPLDEAVWQKANPDIGQTPTWEYLRDNARMARNSPTFYNTFVRYHANSAVRSISKYLNPELFSKSASSEPMDWSGNYSAAFDIGTIDDFAGIARCKKVGDCYQIEARGFCPADGEHDITEQPLKLFIERDELIATPGNTTDLEEVERFIRAWSQAGASGWGYDPNNAMIIAQRLEKDGIDCASFRQSYGMYNESMRLFLKCLRDGKIIHDGSELLKWAAGNTCVKEHQGMWMPDKENSEGKIDPFVAVLMAFRLEALGEKQQGSVYNTRGPIVV